VSERLACVSKSVTVTVAPGIAAPVLSVTVPTISPVVTCAPALFEMPADRRPRKTAIAIAFIRFRSNCRTMLWTVSIIALPTSNASSPVAAFNRPVVPCQANPSGLSDKTLCLAQRDKYIGAPRLVKKQIRGRRPAEAPQPATIVAGRCDRTCEWAVRALGAS
jgi:hypothetical protein